ncbi:hypothetical protein TSTA_059880 [Talaromyces stipitatus ATCC 10500]|uniref:Reverse transcriptase domain-containing protein n=1 Tax=Talaromyces stipitatus (strain ATCC 10500 / CBS 375.48 / QM 6759 / NRRL 1006) TaxID=441959 RepID=B8LTB6_TALSN|nr:uncharacterized protein TSTA_059880 [Talaromyces stipitatus ATCC 10500]EED22490.1 hypothetical protein TSTA_059880 [Talaromyces stipitatus ATCC 10500]
MSPITLDEVRMAVTNVKPNKALGLDRIPNLVLQRLLPTIEAYLVNLFNSIIVILCKPGKPNYSNLKVYCLIVLLSTIGKALELVLARHLSYLVEQYNLLPKQHVGGRCGHSCELAIHLLLEETHNLIKQILAKYLDVIVLGYIDDIFIMIYRASTVANYYTLTKVHQVAECWERTHASKFAPAKYQLTHF